MKKTKTMKNDKQILIIEQDRLAGLDLQRQLEKKEYSVQRPISLIDAEIVISKDKPDLIIADTDIKKQSFFERIKKYLKKYKLPLIWIGTSAKKDSEGISVIGTFSKPFDSKKVVTLIVNYFNKKISQLFRRENV